MEYRPTSFRLDIRSLDDLAPLLRFIRDEFFEVRGRTTGHNPPLLCKPRLHVGRRESCVNFLVESRDDFLGSFPPPWSAEVTPKCFIVRDANGQALSYIYYENEPGRSDRERVEPHKRQPRRDRRLSEARLEGRKARCATALGCTLTRLWLVSRAR
jgi:hypothetical protein